MRSSNNHDLIGETLNLIKLKERKKLKKLLKKQFEIFLDPIFHLLSEDIEIITIIPDGDLFNLPFEALITPSGKYLVEEFDIKYCSTFAMLNNQLKERNSKKTS